MKKNRKIDFSIGIFDEVSELIKEKIKKESGNCELYGIGVYTDEVVIREYMTYPTKNTKERMNLVKKIEGVDFVFEVYSSNKKEVKKIIEQACLQALKDKNI